MFCEMFLDSDHFLHPDFSMLPSGCRYRLPKMKNNRYKYSFVPYAIRLLNSFRMYDSLYFMYFYYFQEVLNVLVVCLLRCIQFARKGS